MVSVELDARVEDASIFQSSDSKAVGVQIDSLFLHSFSEHKSSFNGCLTTFDHVRIT